MRSVIWTTVLVATCVAAWCGSVAVSPVRVQLTDRERAAVITVENQSAVARVYQIETVAWTQSAGEDVYSPTHDLIAVPPVFQLAAGHKQIVRLGTQLRQSAREQAFRVFVQEL